jgi:hypothetical protein
LEALTIFIRLRRRPWALPVEFHIPETVWRKRMKRGRNNAHVGIYIGDHQFIHASSSTKEIKIDSMETSYYSQRFLKGVRVKELELPTPML